MQPRELIDAMPQHDLAIMAGVVGEGIRQGEAPAWREHTARLSDIGRHLLLRAPARVIAAAAMAAWVEATKNPLRRMARKSKAATAMKTHGRAIIREIEAAQVHAAGERAA